MRGDPLQLQATLQRFRQDAERRTSIQGGHDTHSFELPVFGAGEASTRCYFDLAFTMQPAFHYGAALAIGDLKRDQLKTEAFVSEWVQTDTGLYVGADVVVTVTGHPRQRTNFTLTFAGICIQTPVGQALDHVTLNDPI